MDVPYRFQAKTKTQYVHETPPYKVHDGHFDANSYVVGTGDKPPATTGRQRLNKGCTQQKNRGGKHRSHEPSRNPEPSQIAEVPCKETNVVRSSRAKHTAGFDFKGKPLKKTNKRSPLEVANAKIKAFANATFESPQIGPVVVPGEAFILVEIEKWYSDRVLLMMSSVVRLRRVS